MGLHSLAYDELDRQSNQLAQALAAGGIGRGDVVLYAQRQALSL